MVEVAQKKERRGRSGGGKEVDEEAAGLAVGPASAQPGGFPWNQETEAEKPPHPPHGWRKGGARASANQTDHKKRRGEDRCVGFDGGRAGTRAGARNGRAKAHRPLLGAACRVPQAERGGVCVM